MTVVRLPLSRRQASRSLPEPRLTREDAKRLYARTQLERDLLQKPSHTHPWAIVQIAIGEKSVVIRRFANRQDAEDLLRALSRLVRIMEGYNKPTSTYSMCFDAPAESY